ncbi:MAG: PrsW family intramembrane metalloprotease, partial [Euryarchaeota archaeon]|nr:PrsW family intramembrane metalloprotease [Euryarchaeota archaeon]
RLAVGESVPPLLYLGHVLFLSWAALLLLAAAGRLLERDDVALGVKPGLFTVFAQGAARLVERFSRRPLLASSLLAFVSALVSLPLALLAEVALGMAVLYLLGMGQASITVMLFLFAAIEELVKPLPVFALKREMPELVDGRKGLALGVLAGFGFSFLETLFIALAALFYVPSMVLKIIALRSGTTLLVHGLATGIMGYGIARSRGWVGILLFLALATAIHGGFNFLVVRP